MIDFIQVGKKITTIRKSQHLSQEELADKMYVTRQCISKWELGNAIPSIEAILQLSQIFKVSIDEILCLNEEEDIDLNNIFKGHERMFIINKLIHNELDVELADVFYQLSPSERFLILKNIKDGITKTDSKELEYKLTNKEKLYLSGGECTYEIKKRDNRW